MFDYREAAAGAGDRRAKLNRRISKEDRGRVDHQPHVAAGAERVDAPNRAERRDDPGEHQETLVNSDRMSSPTTVVQVRVKRGIRLSTAMPNAWTPGQPSPPMTAGAWNQAMRSTRLARR